MKLSVLLMALFSFTLTPVFACGGGDDDKDELRPSTYSSASFMDVHCGGDKDDDKEE